MDKIYILFNSDTNEVMATSKDESFIEELEYNYFLRDCYNEFYWIMYHTIYDNGGLCHYNLKKYNKLTNETDIKYLINDIWEDILEWYKEFVYIFEEDIM